MLVAFEILCHYPISDGIGANSDIKSDRLSKSQCHDPNCDGIMANSDNDSDEDESESDDRLPSWRGAGGGAATGTGAERNGVCLAGTAREKDVDFVCELFLGVEYVADRYPLSVDSRERTMNSSSPKNSRS